MHKDLVSIITPSYNSGKFIGDTIKSVLNQSYNNWEMIITDDCSTDNSVELIQKYTKEDKRIKLIQLSENSGPAVARNRSIMESSGRFIAFLDSDDQWVPEKLEKQIGFMLKNGIDLSYASYMAISEAGEMKGVVPAPAKVSYQKMILNNYIGCLTAIYDTSRIGKIFMPNIKKRQDWGLWLQILRKVKFAYAFNEPLGIYRIRKESVSSKKFELLHYNWYLYREIEGFSKMKSFIYIIIYLAIYFAKKIRLVLSNTVNNSTVY